MALENNLSHTDAPSTGTRDSIPRSPDPKPPATSAKSVSPMTSSQNVLYPNHLPSVFPLSKQILFRGGVKTQEAKDEPQEDFEQFYLRQITAEFADDLEKLRKASDFKEESVPMLIQALKQGVDSFSEEEKKRSTCSDGGSRGG
ncbi:MAG: hypothetical protein Q9163_002545 [Psora crenata]